MRGRIGYITKGFVMAKVTARTLLHTRVKNPNGERVQLSPGDNEVSEEIALALSKDLVFQLWSKAGLVSMPVGSDK
jgi:hypothetical protein